MKKNITIKSNTQVVKIQQLEQYPNIIEKYFWKECETWVAP